MLSFQCTGRSHFFTWQVTGTVHNTGQDFFGDSFALSHFKTSSWFEFKIKGEYISDINAQSGPHI